VSTASSTSAVPTAERAHTPAAVRAAHGHRDLARRIQPFAALLLVAVVIGLPLWLVVVTAAKDTGQALDPSFSPPSSWHLLSNLRQAFSQGEVLRALLGSVLVVLPTVITVLVLGAAASWVLARRGGRLTSVLYGFAISGILLPPAVITVVLLLRQIGIAGHPIGMVAVYSGMYLSTVIFFMVGFIRTLPIELEEAARVDGAGPFTVFTRIILPLLRPVIATATILVCLYTWNDVFYAFFVLGGSQTSTLPLNLFKVASAGMYLNNWNLIFGYVILMTLPLLVVFILAQRRIISGITSGAVK
jgi:raffinose/stachyose/melibiose transport system permease protein